MRRLLPVALGALLAAGWVEPAVSQQERPGQKYLTKDGHLTQELEVTEYEGSGLAAKSRRWTVKPNGAWALAVRDVGVKEITGKLSKEQLAALADDLAKYDLATLPMKNPKKVPADAKAYQVLYGKLNVSTVGPLPKPDPKTVAGRYAGIVDALERHLKPQDKGKPEPSK